MSIRKFNQNQNSFYNYPKWKLINWMNKVANLDYRIMTFNSLILRRMSRIIIYFNLSVVQSTSNNLIFLYSNLNPSVFVYLFSLCALHIPKVGDILNKPNRFPHWLNFPTEFSQACPSSLFYLLRFYELNFHSFRIFRLLYFPIVDFTYRNRFYILLIFTPDNLFYWLFVILSWSLDQLQSLFLTLNDLNYIDVTFSISKS